jgi:hypothetical protein
MQLAVMTVQVTDVRTPQTYLSVFKGAIGNAFPSKRKLEFDTSALFSKLRPKLWPRCIEPLSCSNEYGKEISLATRY